MDLQNKFSIFLQLFFFFSLLEYVFCIEIIPTKYKENITITFGSCNRPTFSNMPTKIFKDIKEFNPDAFIWLGDAAYVDNKILPLYWKPD